MVVLHKHHIVPKHAGETDDPSNLIELTIEEHAEAHRMLYEQHGRWQDKIAYEMLSGQISVAEATKRTQKAYMSNRTVSEETRVKMAEVTRNRIATQGHPMQGKKFSVESRKKMSQSHKGQIPGNKGKPRTPEQIEKDRLAQMKVPMYDCPECGKSCRGKGNLNQHLSKHYGTHVAKGIAKPKEV